MTRYTRPFVVILLLIAVALLVAACGGSTGSENDASTGAATPTLEPVPAEVLARQMAAYVGQVGALQSPSDTLERPLNLVGITQAVDLTGGSPPCPGYVDTAPDYVFDLTTALSVLKIGSDAQPGDCSAGAGPLHGLCRPRQPVGRQHRQADRQRPVA